MIKILYILEATSGGTQKHVIDLARKIDKSKFQIDIVYSTNRNKDFPIESDNVFGRMYGLPIHRTAALSDLPNIWKIRNIIKQNGYDVVHCHSTKAGFVGRIAAFLSRHNNIIYSPHGFMFCDNRILFKRYLYLTLEKYMGYFTKKLIAVSGSERDLAIQHNIVPDKKIITINNSIETSDNDEFTYINKVDEKLKLNNAEIILGTVGRLYYQKDPLTLIKSFKLINDKFPNTKLIMVGDGPLEKDCIKLINKLGLEGNIQLEGFQKDSHLYYKMFDIFILSSHYEGMPYSLLEAMSLGIPAVGTDVVGIKDLIIHNETGYLVPEENHIELASAIIKMIEHPEQLSVFSQNSIRRVHQKFDFDEGIKNYQNFYYSLCPAT